MQIQVTSSVPYPAFTSELDYEMEIAAVVGREGINIRKGIPFFFILLTVSIMLSVASAICWTPGVQSIDEL